MNDKSLLILGRQPALGLAELESLFGADELRPIGNQAAVLAAEPSSVHFARLGGSIKLCRIFGSVETTEWPELQRHLEQKLPKLAATMPEGKITLGLSAYGLSIKPQQLLAAGLTVKKLLRGGGRSVRLVPNQTSALNSAQVLHNKLTGENGCEIVFVRDGGGRTIIARTIAEQDIETYTLRDRGRPKRDARVGMLPPKLAQIIINLAVGQSLPDKSFTVLDPFCGTGVVLQEAMLMGYSVIGSDIEPRMGDYTAINLDWLWREFPRTEAVGRGWQLGDATNMIWETSQFIEKNGEVVGAKRVAAKIDAVACETYLGRPFTNKPSPEVLSQTINSTNLILKKFLANIHGQLPVDTRLCLAVPAWHVTKNNEQRTVNKNPAILATDYKLPATDFVHLPLIDQLHDLGYNRVRFEHVRDEQLLYYREDQIVARELLVLTRK